MEYPNSKPDLIPANYYDKTYIYNNNKIQISQLNDLKMSINIKISYFDIVVGDKIMLILDRSLDITLAQSVTFCCAILLPKYTVRDCGETILILGFLSPRMDE